MSLSGAESAEFDLGIQAAQAGDLETAIELFRAVIERDPEHVEAHYKLGWVLGSQGFLDPALRSFEQVVRLDPQHQEARYNLGAILLQKAQLESVAPGQLDLDLLRQAQAAFKTVMEINAFDPKSLAMLNLIERAIVEAERQGSQSESSLEIDTEPN